MNSPNYPAELGDWDMRLDGKHILISLLPEINRGVPASLPYISLFLIPLLSGVILGIPVSLPPFLIPRLPPTLRCNLGDPNRLTKFPCYLE